MLKLTNVLEPEKIYNESDFYIPVSIWFKDWNDNVSYPSHCWGIYSGDRRSLFEIAINKRTGKIKYITLVLSPKIHHEMPSVSDQIKTAIGLPAFETQEWDRDDYHTALTQDFNVYIKENRLRIVLLQHPFALKIINDRVIFYFDKDNVLCAIEITDISLEAKDLLEESLKATEAW